MCSASLNTPIELSSSLPQSSPKVGDVRSKWLFPVLLALSIITFVVVLYLTRYMNFFYDEWDFVTAYRPAGGVSILFPHNEHWSTIPILIWKLLFTVFGLRSHVPYEAAALAGHVACVLLLFALIRRRSGDLPAFAAAFILLVLGSGATDIIWAFQVAWTLSIAFGLLAMLLVESSPTAMSPWRVGAISGALLCSLMSSGIGLSFLAAVTVGLVADQRRRRYLLAVIVPMAAYLTWFLAYGAGLAGTPGAPCPACPTAFGADIRAIGPGYIANVFDYASLGLKTSAAGVVGLPGIAGQIVPGILVLLLALHWFREGSVESWELGLVAGLIVQFTLIGLVRVRFSFGGATDSHYVYVGVVYFLPLIAHAIRRLPWHGLWRVALPSAFAIAILANGTLLIDRAIAAADLMPTENAELRTVELFRGAPDMALNKPLDKVIMPQLTAASYFAAINELGSPVPTSTPDRLSDLPPQAVDRQMLVLFGDAVKVMTGGQQPTQGLACQRIDSSAGSITDLRVLDGRSVIITAGIAGQGTISVGFMEQPLDWVFSRQVQIPAETFVQVHLPDTGRPVLWRVRIVTSRMRELQICGANSLQFQTGGAAGSALERGLA